MEIGWALGGLPGSSNPVKSNPSSAANDKRGSNRAGQTDGVRRDIGGRAVSLGFAQGRKRGPYRPLSVGADVR
jgi:alpha-1,3-glucosyltransferase